MVRTKMDSRIEVLERSLAEIQNRKEQDEEWRRMAEMRLEKILNHLEDLHPAEEEWRREANGDKDASDDICFGNWKGENSKGNPNLGEGGDKKSIIGKGKSSNPEIKKYNQKRRSCNDKKVKAERENSQVWSKLNVVRALKMIGITTKQRRRKKKNRGKGKTEEQVGKIREKFTVLVGRVSRQMDRSSSPPEMLANARWLVEGEGLSTGMEDVILNKAVERPPPEPPNDSNHTVFIAPSMDPPSTLNPLNPVHAKEQRFRQSSAAGTTYNSQLPRGEKEHRFGSRGCF